METSVVPNFSRNDGDPSIWLWRVCIKEPEQLANEGVLGELEVVVFAELELELAERVFAPNRTRKSILKRFEGDVVTSEADEVGDE